MFGLPAVALYGGVGALVIIIALSGVVWVQHGRLGAKAETIAAMELVVDAWEQKAAAKQAKIDELRAAIAEQNSKIEAAAELGRLADERQRVIDGLMAELARAEDDLRVISDKYGEMREVSEKWDVCETYEQVLRSIALAVSP